MVQVAKNLAYVAIGIGAFALGGALLLPGPSLTGPDSVALPIGVESNISIEIQNRSLARLRINRVDTSCGCLTVAGFPDTVSPFSTRTIDLAVTPHRSQWGEPQTIQVVLESGRTLVTACTIEPEPLWHSFPGPINPVLTKPGEFVLAFNEAYSSIVTGVEFDIGAPDTLPGTWEPRSSTVRVEADIASFDDVVMILIGPDGQTPVWAERVRFPRE